MAGAEQGQPGNIPATPPAHPASACQSNASIVPLNRSPNTRGEGSPLGSGRDIEPSTNSHSDAPGSTKILAPEWAARDRIRYDFTIRLLLWPVLLLLASFATADYRTGIDALNRGDHARALSELEPLAESGDNRAQWSLSYMYRRGLGVPKNPTRAEHWRKRSVQGTLGPTIRKRPVARASPQIAGRGSGFVVNDRGQVVTNHHVVANCRSVRVRLGRRTAQATMAAADSRADLAVLDSSASLTRRPALFRQPTGAVLGERVLIAGYPLQGLLSREMHVAAGIVSALGGPRGDRRLIQIGTPVQPGNSGGPVLDRAGRVIGVVAGVLPPKDAARAGAIGTPQISFAIRGELVSSFLDRAGIAHRATGGKVADTGALSARAEGFTVVVECIR